MSLQAYWMLFDKWWHWQFWQRKRRIRFCFVCPFKLISRKATFAFNSMNYLLTHNKTYWKVPQKRYYPKQQPKAWFLVVTSLLFWTLSQMLFLSVFSHFNQRLREYGFCWERQVTYWVTMAIVIWFNRMFRY